MKPRTSKDWIWKTWGCSRTNDAAVGFGPLVFPVEGAFLDGVEVTDRQDAEEGEHRSEDQVRLIGKHFTVNDRPWIQEHNLDIKEDEQHRNQVEGNRRTRSPFAHRRYAAFIRGILDRGASSAFADQDRQGQHADGERDGHDNEHEHGDVLRQF
jgi:hypothetical protein